MCCFSPISENENAEKKYAKKCLTAIRNHAKMSKENDAHVGVYPAFQTKNL